MIEKWETFTLGTRFAFPLGQRPLVPDFAEEQALAKVDHAFGQLRQMKDGELQGINAEDLLNEL